jgi:RNA polymerase sigma factor (sigma-70 family)
VAGFDKVRQIAAAFWWTEGWPLRPTHEFEDVLQEGYLAALGAARKFHPTRAHATWMGYLATCVWNRLRRLRTEQRLIRVPAAAVKKANREASEAGPGPPGQRPSQKPSTYRKALASLAVRNVDAEDLDRLPGRDGAEEADGWLLPVLWGAVARLPEAERDLVQRRFGLDRSPMTLREVADDDGVSRTTVMLRQRRVLASLYDELGEVAGRCH